MLKYYLQIAFRDCGSKGFIPSSNMLGLAVGMSGLVVLGFLLAVPAADYAMNTWWMIQEKVDRLQTS